MNEFLSRNKYRLFVLLVLAITLFAICYFVVPKVTLVGDSLSLVRSQLRISETVQGNVESPDSLIAEYRKISEQIEKHTRIQVTSSKILTFVHGTAEKMNVTLQDLSTGEIARSGDKIEIPVSFKARAIFGDLHKFLTEIENGVCCIAVGDVNMNREENGSVSASIRLSVVSRGVAHE